MMYRMTSGIATIAALALLAACGSNNDNTTNTTVQTARVRVVNLNSSVPAGGLYANGTQVGTNVNFGSAASSCFDVPIGQSLSFRNSGAPTNIGTIATPGLAAGQNYTIVLFGGATNAQSVVLSDANITSPTTGNNALRFFNAAGGAGDIYVTSQGGTLGSTPSSSNLAYGASTTGSNMWMSFPTANTQVRFFSPAGSSTTGTPTVNTSFTSSNLSSNRVGTVFLTNQTMTGTGANASVTAAPCS